MDGAALAARRRAELAMSQAWHTEAFARMETRYFRGALDKIIVGKSKPKAQTAAEMLAVFQSFQAAGIKMKISQVH